MHFIKFTHCVLYTQALRAHSSQVLETNVSENREQEQVNVTMDDDVGINVLTLSKIPNNSIISRQIQHGDEWVNFFSRPVEIIKFEWNTTSFSPRLYSPWQRWFDAPGISEKLSNFNLLKGTLCIKFIINGTPFHYGRLFVGAYPAPVSNNTFPGTTDTAVLTTNYYDDQSPFAVQPLRTFYSQRPHILINPSKNESNILKMPFFLPTEWAELNSTSNLANTKWFQLLGKLEVWELNDLRHVNAGTTPVNITALAWMEDMQLAGLSQGFMLLAQSYKPRMTSDEQDKNTVDKVTIKRSARNRLMVMPSLPIFSSMAKASEICTNSSTDVLGFCKKPISSVTEYVTQNYFGNLANWNGNDPVVKLSLDNKQEVTVDPSTVGLDGTDEMAFLNIAKREALIYQHNWAPEDSGTLFRVAVTPTLAPNLLDGQAVMTPVRFVSAPFKYWTGSLKYRIQVVCSPLQGGRLQIGYEPNATFFTSNRETHLTFNHIMDIRQENDITLEVNFARGAAFLPIRQNIPGGIRRGEFTMQLPGPVFTDIGCNGILWFRVLNTLTSPNLSDPVQINVWISAGDSFRVNDPSNFGVNWRYHENIQPIPWLPAQSHKVTMIEPSRQEDDPDQCTTYVINGDYDSGMNNLHDVYFGENVTSIRSHMQRYAPYSVAVYPHSAGTDNNLYTNFIGLNNYPAPPNLTGLSNNYAIPMPPNMVTSINANGPTIMTHICYYRQAFLGFRGSIKYKVVGNAIDEKSLITVNRRNLPLLTSQVSGVVTPITTSTGVSDFYFHERSSMIAHGTGGTHIVDTNLGKGIQYELPFQSMYKFAYCHLKRDGADTFIMDNDPNTDSHEIQISRKPQSESTQFSLRFYVAAGEDFQFFFFVGAPPITGLV